MPLSLNPHNSAMRKVLSSPLHWWRNWGSGRLSDLPKRTGQINYKTMNSAESSWVHNSHFPLLPTALSPLRLFHEPALRVFKGSCHVPRETSCPPVTHSQLFQPFLVRCPFTPGQSYRWAPKSKNNSPGLVWPVPSYRASFLCHPAWSQILVLVMKPHQSVVLLIFHS